MENIILLVHLLTALAIIGLILMQQGKGADMGASFGAGASQTLFGSAGSGNFFSRLTALLAAVFFITSFSLAVVAKNKTTVDDDFAIPELQEIAPERGDVPAVEAESDVPVPEDEAAAPESESDLEGVADPDSAAADTPEEDVPEVPVQ